MRHPVRISHALALTCALGLITGASAAGVSLIGTVHDENSSAIENAVAQLKVGYNLLAFTRTLSDADGHFSLTSASAPDIGGTALLPSVGRPDGWSFEIARAGNVTLEARDSRGRLAAALVLTSGNGWRQVQSPSGLLAGLPQGIYSLSALENGRRHTLGVLYHDGNRTGASPSLHATNSGEKALALRTAASGEDVYVVVRKAGYLPDTIALTTLEGNLGTITLKRDPLESRIDSVLALMTTAQKIAQMTQPLSSAGSYTGSSLYGSTLDGGDQVNSTFMGSMLTKLSTWSNGAKIPVLYGKDAVHGHAGYTGATVFPHNIGLGATRDSALVRKIGEATAQEMWATNVDYNFAPAISVPRDERWGRTYEGFGETPELAVQMGAAMIRGLQGRHYDAPWRVIATAKHFVADGGTQNGVDRGNSQITDTELRTIHLPGYEAAVEQGVLSVMASFNQINGVHQHIDSLRLTGILKNELGFDGFVISDWDGIGNSNSPGFTDDYANSSSVATTKEAVRKAINAGVDMAMEASYPADFRSYLQALVNEGSISQARIDDAVRRILRAKFRAGRMDNFAGPSAYRNVASWIGSADHRAIARAAVRQSLVLLKNDNSALPLAKTAKIYVMGSHQNNTGYQCGGWTLGWQGINGTVSGATSILTGLKTVSGQSSFASSATDADIILYVTGETPYAEWEGDNSSLTVPLNTYENSLATYKASGKKIVTVFISGRPMPVTSLIEKSDAFVAAWLPGSEGAGIADVLFGDYAPTGKLPHSWPKSLSDVPINDGDGKTPLYPYGYGLSW